MSYPENYHTGLQPGSFHQPGPPQGLSLPYAPIVHRQSIQCPPASSQHLTVSSHSSTSTNLPAPVPPARQLTVLPQGSTEWIDTEWTPFTSIDAQVLTQHPPSSSFYPLHSVDLAPIPTAQLDSWQGNQLQPQVPKTSILRQPTLLPLTNVSPQQSFPSASLPSPPHQQLTDQLVTVPRVNVYNLQRELDFMRNKLRDFSDSIASLANNLDNIQKSLDSFSTHTDSRQQVVLDNVSSSTIGHTLASFEDQPSQRGGSWSSSIIPRSGSTISAFHNTTSHDLPVSHVGHNWNVGNLKRARDLTDSENEVQRKKARQGYQNHIESSATTSYKTLTPRASQPVVNASLPIRGPSLHSNPWSTASRPSEHPPSFRSSSGVEMPDMNQIAGIVAGLRQIISPPYPMPPFARSNFERHSSNRNFGVRGGESNVSQSFDTAPPSSRSNPETLTFPVTSLGPPSIVSQILPSGEMAYKLVPPPPGSDLLPANLLVESPVLPERQLDLSNDEAERGLDAYLEYTLLLGSEVTCINFSVDGEYLAIACRNNLGVQVYDVQTGQKICTLFTLIPGERKTEDSEEVNIVSLRFHPHGKYLATGGIAFTVQIWEIAKKRIRNVFKGHEAPVDCLDFSPDGRLLASGSLDCNVRIWNMRDGSSKVLKDPRFNILSVNFNPNGRHLAAGNGDGEVVIWNVRTRHIVEMWRECIYNQMAVFTPDGKRLFGRGRCHALKFWDVSPLWAAKSGSEVQGEVLTRCGDTVKAAGPSFRGHMTYVKAAAISHDGRWVLSSSWDKTAIIWNSHTGVEKWSVQVDNMIYLVEFSPAGGFFACADSGSRVGVWSYREGR